MKYCTYVTFYRGNKLPPFYIGFSTTRAVEDNGYHGTVSSKEYKAIWVAEQRENPHLFKTKILSRFDSMNDAKGRETEIQRFFNVDKNPMFCNMFIQGSKFSCNRKGILHTEATKAKMRAARKLIEPPVKKGTKLTDEHKRKISAKSYFRNPSKESIEKRANSRRGKKNINPMPEGWREKVGRSSKAKMSDPAARRHLSIINTGEKNGFFGKKHSDESRSKMSKTDRTYLSESFWWTDGKTCVRKSECPGESWVKGRKLKQP